MCFSKTKNFKKRNIINFFKQKDIKTAFTAIYFSFLTVYLIFRDVVPLYFLIKSPIISVLIFAAGFVLIVWDLLGEANCIKGRPADFFAAFIIISVISSIVNYKYGIASNLKCIAAMVLQYFVFFSVGSANNKNKILKTILNTVIVTGFILVFCSVLMYIFSIDYSVVAPQNSSLDQGFDNTWGRLWGVFYDPNSASYISLVSFFASFYLMHSYKKVWAYVLYTINALFQMMFIVLTVSRSAPIIMIVMPILSAIYPFLAFYKTNIKKAICSVLAIITVSGVIFGLYQALDFSMPYVKYGVLKAVGVNGREVVVSAFDDFYTSTGTIIKNIDSNHIYLDNSQTQETPTPSDENEHLNFDIQQIKRNDKKQDITNGRILRWQGGIEVFKTSPILGTSPRNTIAMAKDRTPDTVMGKYGWITHCSYLEVLVNTGILGVLALYSAFITIAVLFIKSSMKKPFNYNTYIVFLSFLTVAAGAFFISDVFFVFSINSLLFIYMLGYLYGNTEHKDNSVLFKVFSSLKRRFVK